jgi:uncharacterized protein with beta-barrel porin domain
LFTGGSNSLTLEPGYVINGNVVGTGTDTLAFGGSSDPTFNLGSIGPTQQYQGFANFTVTGGTWTMTGTFGQTNPWTVTGGTLDVTGNLSAATSLTVSGGTLMGTGTVGNTFINSGGTLAPGNPSAPTGTLNVVGNLAFQSAAVYMVTVAGANASKTSVSGLATLAGNVAVTFASASTAKSYDILHAAGGLGGTTFASVSAPNYQASLSYTPTDVFLNLTPVLGAGTTLNQNQQAVATTINTYFNTVGTLPPGLANLFILTGSNLGNALTQLDGEDATGAQQGAFDLMNGFLGLMLDPFVNGRSGSSTSGGALGFAPDRQATLPPDIALAYTSVLKAPPPASFARRWSAWAAGFGGGSTTSGDPVAGSSNISTSTFGYAAGIDYHVSPDTVLGFSLAGGGAQWNLANALGTGRSDALLAGLYGVTHQGPWYFGGALSFGNNWFTTNRTAFAGDQLTAKFQGQSYAARLEGGYRFAVPIDRGAVGITPYAALQAQSFYTPAYSETDLTGGGFGLSYNARSGTDTRGELGARFDDRTALDARPLILRAKLAWAHDWVSNPALDASFESLPGASFTVFGAPLPHDSALTSAGAQLFFTPNWSLLAKFDGEFANGYQLYAGSGTLRYTW